MRRTLEHKEGLFRGELGNAVEIKAVTEAGAFEGYGANFNNVDHGGDMVLPGAFAESLGAKGAARIKLLWQHDPTQPIGKFTDMSEDASGLYVKGQLNMNVQRGAEAYALLKDGAIDGLSIGYRTVDSEIDRMTGVRRLIKVDLFEVSLVTFPMNPASGVRRVKGEMPSKRELEQMLARDAGLSAQQAKALLAKGYNAMLERDAEISDSDPELVSELQRLARLLRAN